MSLDAYDYIPYDSSPFQETHPDHLAVLGRLFGLNTAPGSHCRYLELGCASAGNLIPLAFYQPASEFVGIDRSQRQIDAGQALSAALHLHNISLHRVDILELGDALGHFDYIIAHGVYSWAPAPVRKKLLALCCRLLHPAGIAYVSYNTLPGWRMRGMLRDMLLYAARGTAIPRAQLVAVQSFLETLDTVLTGNETPRARYLREEITSLRRAHPAYLYHEYLTETNEPVLFSEFSAQARAHGLCYVCETELHTNFPDTLPERAASFLRAIDERQAREQYTDFLRNRTFRQSLLCRADANITGDPRLEALPSLALHSDLAPPHQPELRHAKRQRFRTAGDRLVEVTHPLTKAVLLAARQAHPAALALSDLLHEARRAVQVVGATSTVAEQSEHFYGEVFSLFANGAVRLLPHIRESTKPDLERPCANRFTRELIKHGAQYTVTSEHGILPLDAFGVRLASLLDGTRTLGTLCVQLADAIRRDELAIPGPKPKGYRLEKQVQSNVERLVARFAHEGLLAPANAR